VPDSLSIDANLSQTPIAAEYRAVDVAFGRGRKEWPTFDPRLHPPAVVEKARGWWLTSMRVEYDSASVFMDLARSVRSLGEPLDVQVVALRMAQDEIRHAAVCARVVEAMGGEPRFNTAPAPQPVAHPDCGAEEDVLRTVIFGCCMSETVNAARLAKRYAETSDPFVREAFRTLLADEQLHAQFGFHYLQHRRSWLEAHPEVCRSLARYLRFAFAALERHMGAVPFGAQPPTAEERAIGLPDLTDLSATYQETIANATVPALEAFGIDATRAWQTRSLTP
jgi:rubrerythrin